MSTTTTVVNGKKKYYGKYRGKYYTYRRIRGIMSQYHKVKLTCTLSTTVSQQNSLVLRNIANNVSFQFAALSDVILFTEKWADYCQLFGSFKMTGFLMEIIPALKPDLPAGNSYFSGTFRIGLLPQAGQNTTYAELVESNLAIDVSSETKTRKYVPLFHKDFTTVPINVNAAPRSGIPYYLCWNQSLNGNAQTTYRQFTVNCTFYITFRQNVL